MKVYNPDHNEALKPGLKQALADFRRRRGFDPAAWVEAKATLINDYLARSGLKSLTVGLSGGIDSSVVTALAVHAAKLPDSPIQKVVPIMIPSFDAGATGQSDAVRRGRDVIAKYGLDEYLADITLPHEALLAAVDKAMGIEGNDWAKGQAVAHVRTAALSYALSLLSKDDTPGILLGTTNRDEGSYLGYVGKYSDAMVDLQVISDLHKSEVYAVARHLNLPQSTIDAIPTGDMYDNRPDTKVFGAPYDFVELYENYLELSDEDKTALLAKFDEDERAQFDGMAANLENLHRYNGHKYKMNGWPSVFLDVQQSAVPGGWTVGEFSAPFPAPPPALRGKIFVGNFDLSADFLTAVRAGGDRPIAVAEKTVTAPGDVCPARVETFDTLLSPEEAQALIAQTADKNWEPVGDDGIKSHFDAAKDRVGSWRLTTYSPEFAKALWDRISGRIPMTLTIPAGTNVDAGAAKVWRAVGINPAFRFIKYNPAGENRLVAHYDGPPKADLRHGRTSLQSMVMYLTDADPATGGSTRFITNPQAAVPAAQRDLSDWDRPAGADEVVASIAPRQGLAAIFPHRVLHDSEPLKPQGAEKIIVRTDIIYQPVALP